VHRDIKPGNLLLDSRDQLHVGDFGIASAVGLQSFTEAGTILGTAGYLSPEQARGERATGASDRYSLAVVAFELLAGERPYAASSTTVEAARHVTDPVPSIRAVNAELPPTLDRVFERALAKEPADRYPTCADFVCELRGAIHEDAGTTGWIVPRPPIAIPTTQVTRPAGTPTSPPDRRGRSGRPGWLVPLLLLLLLAAGAAAAFAATRGTGSSAPAPKPQSVTVLRTVTKPGRTIQQTVTTTAPPPPTTAATTPVPPTTAAASAGSSGTDLNSEGYAKMRAGDYRGALPLLDQAVRQLSGTDSLGEAYADYNLAYTRFALGQCTGVLALLDHSEQIQGRRSEIEALRRDAQKTCG
jgi:serine/threonine-protein kinase